MNHYCTYFDRGFLIQGLALWRSLAAHDPEAMLWVLAVDEGNFTADVLREIGGSNIRVTLLAELEQADPELHAARENRTRVEYFFTLSPCWPRWLLRLHPEIDRLTYLDADMFFFGSPARIFGAMDAAQGSVLVTEHRFPPWLRHYEQHGRFNVGILSFRNDEAGRGCLDDWRRRCLAWCHDRVEDGRYADQKYLDEWPAQLGAALLVLRDPGVNVAPWNWASKDAAAVPWTEQEALVLYHFARFRSLAGTWWWRSGQLDYGVMPWALRRRIYAPYVQALLAARAEIALVRPGFDFRRQPARFDRGFWRALPLRILFGGDWLRVGDVFLNLRGGIGRWSGQCLATLRTIFLRK